MVCLDELLSQIQAIFSLDMLNEFLNCVTGHTCMGKGVHRQLIRQLCSLCRYAVST